MEKGVVVFMKKSNLFFFVSPSGNRLWNGVGLAFFLSLCGLMALVGDGRGNRATGATGEGEIRGMKWHDLNGDGVLDAGEPGVEGWFIYLDENRNGQFDEGERNRLTDADGNYAFTSLAPGRYLVGEENRTFWVQTFPMNILPSSAGVARMRSPLTTTASSQPIYPVGATGSSVPMKPQTAESTSLIGLDTLHGDSRFSQIDGRGTAVVVMDTGVDLDHPFFGDDLDNNGVADRIVYQYDFADDDDDATDRDGHGTGVTGIVASSDLAYPGVAPGCDIIHLKVFGDNGDGDFGNVEEGLQWVVDHVSTYNIVAVNLSLSDGGNYSSVGSMNGMGDELTALAAMDVMVTCASGNDFYTHNSQLGVGYPASDANAISVGAVYDADIGYSEYGDGATANSTAADRIAPFSQRHGTLTTIMAPGGEITNADLQGGTYNWHGTSHAAPHVAGIAALAQQMATEWLGRRLGVAEFITLMRSTAVIVNDGDDEDDNVVNSGLDFPRVAVYEMALAIQEMNPARFAHTVDLGVGQIVENINFGNVYRPEIDVPEGFSAGDGSRVDGVLVDWEEPSGATHYKLYRADSPTAEAVLLTDWTTATYYLDTDTISGQTHYYWIQAAMLSAYGDVFSEQSARETGWRAYPFGDWRAYKLTYRNCNVMLKEGGNIRVLSLGNKGTVKIREIGMTPSSKSPRNGVEYLWTACVPTLDVTGNLKKFYSEVPVRDMIATGWLASITTKNSHIERLVTAGMGKVKMTGAVDSSDRVAYVSLLSDSTYKGKSSLSVTGAVLAEFTSRYQASSTLKLASKKAKSASGAIGLALGGSQGGWIETRELKTLSVKGASFAPEYVITHTVTGTLKISARGAAYSIGPDYAREVVSLSGDVVPGVLYVSAAKCKVLASGGNVAPTMLYGAGTISKVSAKYKKLRVSGETVFLGGFVDAGSVCAEGFVTGKPDITEISGSLGVSGQFYAGVNYGSVNAVISGDYEPFPAYSGVIKSIKTLSSPPAGSVSPVPVIAGTAYVRDGWPLRSALSGQGNAAGFVIWDSYEPQATTSALGMN